MNWHPLGPSAHFPGRSPGMRSAGQSRTAPASPERLAPAPQAQGQGCDRAPRCLARSARSALCAEASECPTGSLPKRTTGLLINGSVYGNQGRALSEFQDAKWSLVFRIINKTLILKDSCKFGINYEWDDDKTLRETHWIFFFLSSYQRARLHFVGFSEILYKF